MTFTRTFSPPPRGHFSPPTFLGIPLLKRKKFTNPISNRNPDRDLNPKTV